MNLEYPLLLTGHCIIYQARVSRETTKRCEVEIWELFLKVLLPCKHGKVRDQIDLKERESIVSGS